MAQVWIVTTGEFAEGGRVCGVFGELPSDETILRCSPPAFGKWESMEWTGGADKMWRSGCDWLSLDQHEVK